MPSQSGFSDLSLIAFMPGSVTMNCRLVSMLFPFYWLMLRTTTKDTTATATTQGELITFFPP
jgi:hypothetical protein